MNGQKQLPVALRHLPFALLSQALTGNSATYAVWARYCGQDGLAQPLGLEVGQLYALMLKSDQHGTCVVTLQHRGVVVSLVYHSLDACTKSWAEAPAGQQEQQGGPSASMRRPDDCPQTRWLAQVRVQQWIGQHFKSLTHWQLAQELNVGLTSLRTCTRQLGLLRLEMEYWTPEQVALLQEKYPTCGDSELAAYFEQHYPKFKTWTKKHIERKRRYLGLKRTPQMLALIHAKLHNKPLDQARTHEFGTLAQVGDVRNLLFKSGRRHKVIKCEDGCWRPYGPIVWQQVHGPVPAGMRVRFVDGDPSNCDLSNLQLVAKGEVPRLSAGRRLESVKWIAHTLTHPRRGTPAERAFLLNFPSLLHLRRLQLQLQRAIKIAQT